MERRKEIVFKGIASSSAQPRWDLMPLRALLRIIRRFEFGVLRKKEKAWNARSKNQECLIDQEFVISRIVHVINHAYMLLDILEGRAEDDGDDHAAAIGWSGMFLCEATRELPAEFPVLADKIEKDELSHGPSTNTKAINRRVGD